LSVGLSNSNPNKTRKVMKYYGSYQSPSFVESNSDHRIKRAHRCRSSEITWHGSRISRTNRDLQADGRHGQEADSQEGWHFAGRQINAKGSQLRHYINIIWHYGWHSLQSQMADYITNLMYMPSNMYFGNACRQPLPVPIFSLAVPGQMPKCTG
jgi:hypothetical protein